MGDTPIGSAMVRAVRDLNATKMSRKHVVLLSDGKNNSSFDPTDVMKVINETGAASVYCVAFDVNAGCFNGIKTNGGLVYSAANQQELQSQLDTILNTKILVEAE
jgi:Mg-chelatase subunit ChlD